METKMFTRLSFGSYAFSICRTGIFLAALLINPAQVQTDPISNPQHYVALNPGAPEQKPEQVLPFVWQTATPESQGMSSAKLAALKDELARRKTRVFLVIRNDKIVYEWYSIGQDAEKKHGTASLAKAIVGGLSLAVAITDGKLRLDDLTSKYAPEWRKDPRKAKITIRHLGSHTSGLSDSTTKGVKHEEQPSWMGEFWKRLPPPHDPFTIARDQTPLLFEPGAKFQYSNPGIAMLTYCVTAAIKDTPHSDIRTLLRERVMQPLGVPDEEWSAGYEKTFSVNGLDLVGAWGGGSFTPRATARIGRLVMRNGDWDGQRILSREAVKQVTQDAGLPGNCGMGWWTNAAGRYAKLPKDAVWGAGAGDQTLLVIPSLKLIMVRNGETLPTPEELQQLKPGDVFEEFHDPRSRILFEPLVEAIIKAPYSPSPIIKGISWAPRETIIRQAKGSDNWPLTWGDDDNLYAAYGDGNGFEPFVPEKLSLGFAKISGSPENFTGANIRSATGESRGDDKAGKKASGMLMVDGVLYLWARNAANSQLAWSTDHGRTWTWSDWKFTTSFGSPTFLNFSKNYAGARDGYVYVYSHDSDSAYTAADRFVLARAPKSRLKERAAYEFFVKLDAKNNPVWTKEIEKRGAVFTHPGACYRSGISYNAALKRYLWSQTLPASKDSRGPRFQGGFGVYDAPEPWGPWTTVYFTEEWDVGPGETSSFPTKWMSADGGALHLVFSGADCFSVRRATLTLSAVEKTRKRVTNQARVGPRTRVSLARDKWLINGAADDPLVYAALKRLTSRRPATDALAHTLYFPPPESQGGWRKLDQPEEIRRLAGMDPNKLAELRQWLLNSDDRNFAAVVIRNSYIVLEVERGNSAKTDSRRVASVSKAICATVLAIASEQSRQGLTPKRMKFDDPAFQFIPWAHPLSDLRKEKITVRQLLNHTSGICPEAVGAPNDGAWEYVLGHSGDERTAKLAFDPSTASGYSTHALHHASLVCETVTGKPYDQFTIEALFKPIGIEHWWFQYYDGGEKYGRHPSHGLGLPARALARIAYCMLHGGRWGDKQVIPQWFVAETAAPTHNVTGPEMRFKINAQIFSHGWELPARLTGAGGRSGAGIPADARYKPGSGGQIMAFVPSLDLVIARQTGASGNWEYEEYLRQACAAVLR